jgi:hypothetical protein
MITILHALMHHALCYHNYHTIDFFYTTSFHHKEYFRDNCDVHLLFIFYFLADNIASIPSIK